MHNDESRIWEPEKKRKLLTPTSINFGLESKPLGLGKLKRCWGKDGDELGQQATKALQAGDLELAGRLLDELIAKRKQVVDKLAANPMQPNYLQHL